jgi:pimeloyl-ACP methyl ester carboxylesterase
MHARNVLSLGSHGFHRIAYYEWGDPHNTEVLVCVHGLTRCGRDFDDLAEALQDRYRVVCVDLPGRAASHWLTVAADYNPLTYMQDLTALIARLDVEHVDWVGTSLGGLLGMMLAGKANTPIRKLVVNDVGGYIDKPALERIAAYVGADPEFEREADLEAYLRQVNKPFGPLTDEQWARLARNSTRRDPVTGKFRLHYDPRLAEPFKAGFSEAVDLWPVWDAVTCPVLVLRGAESDVLLKETAEEMMTRGPEAQLAVFAGIGHAPMLMDPGQIAVVRDWLLA